MPSTDIPDQRVAEPASAAAPAPMLCVSIHDVAPATWADCLRLVQAVREVADIPLTWLVVPHYHFRPERSAAMEACLDVVLERGDELALHGYSHLDTEANGGGLRGRFLRNVYTRREGEFAALDEAEARRRLELGRAWFAERGWTPSGFVPPAWLLGKGAWRALRASGFAYTSTFSHFHCLPGADGDGAGTGGRAVLSPSLVYAARNRGGRLLSPRIADATAAMLANAPLVRFGLHPPDARYPELVRHTQRVLERLLEQREAVTKLACARRLMQPSPSDGAARAPGEDVLVIRTAAGEPGPGVGGTLAEAGRDDALQPHDAGASAAGDHGGIAPARADAGAHGAASAGAGVDAAGACEGGVGARAAGAGVVEAQVGDERVADEHAAGVHVADAHVANAHVANAHVADAAVRVAGTAGIADSASEHAQAAAANVSTRAHADEPVHANARAQANDQAQASHQTQPDEQLQANGQAHADDRTRAGSPAHAGDRTQARTYAQASREAQADDRARAAIAADATADLTADATAGHHPASLPDTRRPGIDFGNRHCIVPTFARLPASGRRRGRAGWPAAAGATSTGPTSRPASGPSPSRHGSTDRDRSAAGRPLR
ncbi:polysaccharide deacetylase family protein [uncultured Massilia sp.]|uniref:polysaccharide deacetylase family protein n=1 Tax=uncultured Massilia sp. TaxID=169973 RepID=UPI0025E69CCF|nr:polysaccharide deacetylase family protein [uncultured Massilia sp.]